MVDYSGPVRTMTVVQRTYETDGYRITLQRFETGEGKNKVTTHRFKVTHNLRLKKGAEAQKEIKVYTEQNGKADDGKELFYGYLTTAETKKVWESIRRTRFYLDKHLEGGFFDCVVCRAGGYSLSGGKSLEMPRGWKILYIKEG